MPLQSHSLDDTSGQHSIEYCVDWNFAQKDTLRPLTERQAMARHRNGQRFTAILRSEPQAICPTLVTVVGKNRFIGVVFTDEYGRESMEYSFFQKSDGRYFLSDIKIYTYADNDPLLTFTEAAVVESVHLNPDGTGNRRIDNRLERHLDTVRYNGLPVDETSWEPEPEFGDYHSIARRER